MKFVKTLYFKTRKAIHIWRYPHCPTEWRTSASICPCCNSGNVMERDDDCSVSAAWRLQKKCITCEEYWFDQNKIRNEGYWE